MRNGSVTEQDSEFLLSRCLDKLPSNERRGFDNALWLVPTCKEANQHLFNYLQHMMISHIAKINAQMHISRSDGKNWCIQGTLYPLKNALCVGAKVMLLKNFVVERKLMNGSVGHVKAICYKHPAGPRNVANLCTNISCDREMREKNAVPFVHYHFDIVWYSLFTKV
jgi:hypothetical protein